MARTDEERARHIGALDRMVKHAPDLPTDDHAALVYALHCVTLVRELKRLEAMGFEVIKLPSADEIAEALERKAQN